MSPRSHSNAFARRRARDARTHEDEVDATGPLDLATLYRQHADAVAIWVRRLGGPELDIEDCVHEVFLVAQRRLGEWRGDAKVTTWLYEIAFRVVQDRRRWWR